LRCANPTYALEMTNDVVCLAIQLAPRRTRHNVKRQSPAGTPDEVIGELSHSRNRFTVLQLQREAQEFINLVHQLCEEFQTVLHSLSIETLAHAANSKARGPQSEAYCAN
jgi:hypothetical protein